MLNPTMTAVEIKQFTDPKYFGIKDTPTSRAALRKFVMSFPKDAASYSTGEVAQVTNVVNTDTDEPLEPGTQQLADLEDPGAPESGEYRLHEWLLFVDDYFYEGNLARAIESGKWDSILHEADILAKKCGLKLVASMQNHLKSV